MDTPYIVSTTFLPAIEMIRQATHNMLRFQNHFLLIRGKNSVNPSPIPTSANQLRLQRLLHPFGLTKFGIVVKKVVTGSVNLR